MRLRFAFVLSALALPAAAQVLEPTGNVIAFDTLPTGLFTAAKPIGLIGTQDNGPVYYTLQADAKQTGYTVGNQLGLTRGLMITGQQDILQGSTTNRWVQVQIDSTDGSTAAWVLCGQVQDVNNPDQSCTNFTVQK